MDQDRWNKVNEIFHAALELDPQERRALVITQSRGDLELQSEVEQLLYADAEAGSYLEAPLVPNVTLIGPAPFLVVGDVLCNRFQIVRKIGEGGMGLVFEAFDSELAVRVALKIIRPDIASNPEAITRFRQEVRLARSITHPNICRTFDLERETYVQNGRRTEIVFLTMEFLDGITLREHLQRTGSLEAAQAILIGREVAAALDAAHSAGIVHRDVKPGNIMLCGAAYERAVVTDFGLARLDLSEGEGRSITLPGTVGAIGTLAYMAPEQLQGGPITTAVDIYAFGVVLFEMFTGHKPATGPAGSRANVKKVRETGPAETALHPIGRAMMELCLHREPARRPTSAMEVVEAFERSPHQPLVGHLLRGNLRSRRKPLLVFSLFLLAVSLFTLSSRLWRRAASTALTPGALIYLAPLQNGTSQTTMDGISELLKASLSQSTQITLLDDARTGDILQNMAQKPDASITPTIGREIAMRSGAVRVVFPALSFSGNQFRLDLQVEQPSNTPASSRRDWTAHWTWSAKGDNSATAGQAVRDAADWLRHLAGESANDIARLSAPPEDVTTANWAALSDYALAVRLFAQTRREEAVAALQSAVEKDSHFALAYAMLGDIQVNIGRREQGFQAYAAALDADRGERLSLRERARIKGLLGQDTGDLQASEAAYREYTLYYPHDYIGWFRRGMPLYSMGRIPEAIQVLEKAHSVAPSQPLPLNQLATANLVLGNMSRVDALLADLRANYPRGYYLYTLAPVQITRGEYAEARSTIDDMAHSTTPVLDFVAVPMAASLLAEQGDLQGAAQTLTTRLDHLPADASLLVKRAHVRCRLRQFDLCMADVNAAIESDPSAATMIDASRVLGNAVPSSGSAARRAIRNALNALAGRKPSRDDGLSAEIAIHQILGEAMLANGNIRGAVEQLREASALNPTVELREPLARALEAYADQQNDIAATSRLLDEALDLRMPFAGTAARIWAHFQVYPPGAYADNLEAALRLAHKLGNAEQARVLASKIAAVRHDRRAQ
jgi:serine/threonine protein kinase/tetratricopeptide (TPR) repeat protein